SDAPAYATTGPCDQGHLVFQQIHRVSKYILNTILFIVHFKTAHVSREDVNIVNFLLGRNPRKSACPCSDDAS
ncbi:MAG: hypothetical protein K0M73_19220, partial [Hydrogenophaga sp.]|nr:hypothetical protein [Hydrogenophaga sp.]